MLPLNKQNAQPETVFRLPNQVGRVTVDPTGRVLYASDGKLRSSDNLNFNKDPNTQKITATSPIVPYRETLLYNIGMNVYEMQLPRLSLNPRRVINLPQVPKSIQIVPVGTYNSNILIIFDMFI